MPLTREEIERVELEEGKVVQEILRFLSRGKSDCFYTIKELVDTLEHPLFSKDLPVLFNNLKRDEKKDMMVRLLTQLKLERKIEERIVANTSYYGPLEQ